MRNSASRTLGSQPPSISRPFATKPRSGVFDLGPEQTGRVCRQRWSCTGGQ